MSEPITYEADLTWMKYINHLTSVNWEPIIDDINSFHPTTPIAVFAPFPAEFVFSVQRDEEGRQYINVKTSIDPQIVFAGESIEESTNLLDNAIVCRLKDMLFAMNLAYPGHIHIYYSNLCRNGQPVKAFSFAVDISGLAYTSHTWIPYENLTINQCWKWLSTKTNFLSDISKTPMDRALHALSYESEANDDIFIFYVIIGIEAIYNGGSHNENSVSLQRKRKIQSVLGDMPKVAIAAIRNMYALRSKLVHGAANIYKAWDSGYYPDNEEETVERERDYMITAAGILIATIQKFIRADANVLIEKTTVSLGTL